MNARRDYSKIVSNLNHTTSNSNLDSKMLSPGGVSASDTSANALMRQNQELRQRLAEESINHKRRVDSFKQAQQSQAALVSRLQSKVQQYRQRCNDLEDRMNETLKIAPCQTLKVATTPPSSQVMCSTSLTLGQSGLPCLTSLDSVSTHPYSRDYNVGNEHVEHCHRLEEERSKSEQLVTQNLALRQQLEESNRTNESLTNDLQKLTNDWANLRDEIMFKDDEYKEEEQAFKDYYINEQNRLSRMLREVKAVKEAYRDIQMSLKNDIAKMGADMLTANKDITEACNAVYFSLTQSNALLEGQLKDASQKVNNLEAQLATCRVQYESALHEVNERDLRITELTNQLKRLEDRSIQAESQALLANRYNETIERLNNSIREIAQAVIQDAEIAERELNAEQLQGTMQHLHLSQNPSVSLISAANASTTKSPRQSSSRVSQAFAEGTISAVQATLHKYQLALHDLQVKYQNGLENLNKTSDELEKSKETNSLLTTKLVQLTEKLDMSNSKIAELLKERDILQKSLEEVRQQKHETEKAKAETNKALDVLTQNYEKLQLKSGQFQKQIDSLEDDKKAIELEAQQILKDKNMIELNLRSEEGRSSQLREEIISLREELNKISLSKELLEQQRVESDNLLNLIEKQKTELEYDLDKTLIGKYELQERLEKASSNNASKFDELKTLQVRLDEAQEEQKRLHVLNKDQTKQIMELKKELNNVEKSRLELETDNLSFSEKLKCLHLENEKILQDLASTTRDRSEIHNQLTACGRKREALNEEVLRTRQKLEQMTESNNRLSKNFEDICKEVEEKKVKIELQDKEIHRLQELIASSRSEKESLESVLFDTNVTLETIEGRRCQLERDLQESLVREESLKNTVGQLQKDLDQAQRKLQEIRTQLANATRAAENELHHKISNLKSNLNEAEIKYADEISKQKNAFEKRLQMALQTLQTTKDDEIDKLQERIDALQGQMEAMAQQHEEAIIRAENEKQQALLIEHRDKQALAEKLGKVTMELKSEQEHQERNKREFHAREEKLRNAITQLKDEVLSIRAKEEEKKITLEECIKNQEMKLSSLREERDSLSFSVNELKAEIHRKENKIDEIRNELQEVQRKTKEVDRYNEAIRKELTDCQRQLADRNIECDKYSNSNKELRDHIKQVESARREQARSIDEALHKIASLEENKNLTENEKNRVLTLLKDTENSLAKTTHELNSTKNLLQKTQIEFTQKDENGKEAHNKLALEIELKEKALQELTQVKRQLADLEANLCATRQELGRTRCNFTQEEHRFHKHEEELLVRIEESRGREKRLEDEKHNLEVCLSDATHQLQELKARLAGGESRIRALNERMICLDLQKRNTEQKLSSVVQMLRRIAGIQLDGSVIFSHRLLSPSRKFSPGRYLSAGPSCHESSHCSVETSIDIDPDLVRKGLRNLMHQMTQIEREKVDLKTQLAATKKQLQGATDQQLRCDGKVTKLQQMLRHLQEEKSKFNSEKQLKATALRDLDDKLKTKTKECHELREKFAKVELQLAAIDDENISKEERLEKLRQHAIKLETDKRNLQEEIAKVEGRASKLELQRIAMEGDITRLQMALKEKENNARQFQECLDNQNKSFAKLEDRCTSLKLTVDQLKDRLQKASISEIELRGEIKSLKRELSDKSLSQHANEDKLKMLEKSLQAAENEKRITHERFESAQSTINELRRNQQAQLDTTHRLQELVTKLEVQKTELESKFRSIKWARDGEFGRLDKEVDNNDVSHQLKNLQQEKCELLLKLQILQERVKHLEKEIREKSSIDSNRLSAVDRANVTFGCGLDHVALEQEACDLRLQVKRLETQLAEKDSELARLRATIHDTTKCGDASSERLRGAHVEAEKLIDVREQAHRREVMRLENQISTLREQLTQEAKRRQQYILRSSKANREMQHLRSTLGDSLRHVSQQPLDTNLLESESRRLDTAVSMSLPTSYQRDLD